MVQIDVVEAAKYAGLIIGAIGWLMRVFGKRYQLPKWAKRWYDRIGPEKIEAAIADAASYTNLSEVERKKKAVDYLKRNTERQFGSPIPDSIASLLVEFVYQQWKRRAGK